MSRHIKAVLWDFDGTLVDSAEATIQALSRALTLRGHDISDLDPRDLVGPPLSLSLADRGLDTQEIDSVRVLYQEEFIKSGIPAIRLFDGMFELMCNLKHAGVVQAIVSKRLQTILSKIVVHLELNSVVAIACGRHSLETKSTILAYVMDQLDLKPGLDVAIVGDQLEDMEAGRQCGLLTIGVQWGYGEMQELVSKAHLVVSSVERLRRVLRLR